MGVPGLEARPSYVVQGPEGRRALVKGLEGASGGVGAELRWYTCKTPGVPFISD